MDFELSDEQQMFRDVLRQFVNTEIKPVAREMEQSGQYPHEIVAKMAEMGLFGITVGAEYGGLDLDTVSMSLVFEEISMGWMGIAGILGSHSLSCRMITLHGTEEQKQRWLPELATGQRRTAIALTEPGAGSDLQGISTRAWRDGGEYVIRGTKTWITNARFANPLPVLVKTDPDAEPRHRGMSVLMVEAGTPGYEVLRDLGKLGYKGPESCEVVLDDARVPADNLLGGQEGLGFKQVMSGLEVGRINIAARGVGVTQAALDASLAYSQQREAFGQRHRRVPGHPAQAGRHGHRAGSGPAANPLGRPPHRSGPASRRGGGDGQVLRLGGGHQGVAGVDADPRQLRVLD